MSNFSFAEYWENNELYSVTYQESVPHQYPVLPIDLFRQAFQGLSSRHKCRLN